jgi:hypothetical protein
MPPNTDPHSTEGAVQRRLKARHLAMIALGGTIGTGLFVGSGGALASGGPVGTLLGYVSTCLIVWAYQWLTTHASADYGCRRILHDDRFRRNGNFVSRLWRIHTLCHTL